ncbi:MAG: right-handed parallel beta-helix repeat-containing protein [Armatimonadota bacterium]
MRHLYSVAFVILVVFTSAAIAADFHVSPDGDDDAAGTADAPWQTLEKASQGLQPGDTVILMPGDYAGQWKPQADGTADQPITLKAQTRRAVRLIGSGNNTHAVHIEGRSHIQVEGLCIQPEPRKGRWMLVRDSSNITITDCQMQDGTGGMPFHIDGCDQVRMQNCLIRRFVGGNMARVSNSTHVLIEGCAISRTGHSPLQFYPDESNQFIVIRGCVFHNGWGRNFEHFGTKDILFEHNILTNALNGGRSADAKAKCLFKRGIFRFNRIYRN